MGDHPTMTHSGYVLCVKAPTAGPSATIVDLGRGAHCPRGPSHLYDMDPSHPKRGTIKGFTIYHNFLYGGSFPICPGRFKCPLRIQKRDPFFSPSQRL